ncbi:hypothetical protein HanPI659440_Chr10g0393061 [Helianthus annuus]|nr:hypothetical protein HanPI659440_Chr10g0393061 [Helianthus annuus]
MIVWLRTKLVRSLNPSRLELLDNISTRTNGSSPGTRRCPASLAKITGSPDLFKFQCSKLLYGMQFG